MSQQLIDVLLRMDDRISRLEQTHSSSGTTMDSLLFRRPNTDPAVTDKVRLRQLEQLLRGRPHQPGDPAAADLVRARVQDLLDNLVSPVDPPPDEILNASIGDLIKGYRGGFVDPAPRDISRLNTVEELEIPEARDQCREDSP